MHSGESLSKSQRVACLVIALCLAAALFLAMYVKPDSRGHGTHQQLGLPPCTFKFLFDVPCPACGMTTSWALAIRGDWAQSIRANAGGFLLFLIAILSVPLLLATWLRGQLPWSGMNWFGPVLFGSAFAIALIQWIVRLLG